MSQGTVEDLQQAFYQACKDKKVCRRLAATPWWERPPPPPPPRPDQLATQVKSKVVYPPERQVRRSCRQVLDVPLASS